MSKHLTPIQAIKKKCKEQCCCGDLSSWKECSVVSCPLWAYRLGKRPKTLTSEKSNQKQADSYEELEKKQPSGVLE